MNERLIKDGKEIFFDALCKINPIPEIIRSAYTLIGWPVIFVSGENEGLIQIPSKAIGFAEFDGLLGHAKDASLLSSFRDLYNTTWNYNGNNIQLLPGNSAQYPLLAYISVKKRNILISQCVLHIPKENIDDIEYRFLELIYQALSTVCRRQNLNESMSKRKLSFDFKHIIDQEDDVLHEAGQSYIKDLVKGLSAALDENYIVITALFEEGARNEIFPIYFTEELYRKYPQIICTQHGDNVVILYGGLLPGKSVKEQIENFLNFCTDNNICLGISAICSDLTKIKSLYNQSYLTALTGIRLFEKTGIYYYEELEPLQMLYPLVKNYSLSTFLHPSLIKLIEWDKKNGTEYLKTLRAYLITNKNNKESAGILSVHQNTLLYRLQKIKDLFHIDFEDGRMNLTLLVDILFILVKDPKLLQIL